MENETIMKRYPEVQIYAQGFEKVSLLDSSFDKSDRQCPLWQLQLAHDYECLSSK